MKQKKQLSESKKKWLTFLAVIAVGMTAMVFWLLYEAAPLDRLKEYEVHVDVNRDGTMDITYRYRWEVLNDSKEGPLEWVELGLANPECELVDYGGAVKGRHSKYQYMDGAYGDSLIGFDLDRDYYKGEIVDFYFTVRQRNMLCENEEDASLPFYDFTPGWFEGMVTEHYRFTWSDSLGIQESNADRVENGVHVWEGKLKKGESRQLKVFYDMAAFEQPQLVRGPQPGGGVKKSSSPEASTAMLFVFLSAFIGYQLAWGRDNYKNGRGYYGGGSHHGGSGSCACACAGCACACACAGGGRAGCSRKDFFRSKRENKTAK